MSEDRLDEFINDPQGAVQRWTERVVSGRVGELERRLYENSVELNGQRVQVAMDRDPALSGSWRTTNQDPAFIRWLSEVDPLAGVSRQQGLTQAYNTGASDRVAAIFKAFLASRIPHRERTETRLPHETSARQPSVRVADLQRGKIWTKGEIARFYDDCRRGKFDKRDAERNQIEAEIVLAAKQGRMAPDAIQPRNGKGSDF